MLIYDHTLLPQSPRTLFCIYLSKENLLEKDCFWKISKDLFLLLTGRPCGRPLAEQNCSVGRPSGRPTCTKVHACTSVDRAGRPAARAVLSVCSGRPAQLTDREFYSLFGNYGWSSGRPLFSMVRNSTVGGRPTGQLAAEFSANLAPNG